MQITSNMYKSRVAENAVQLEQQQAMLVPPGKFVSNISTKPVVHVVSPYGAAIKEMYPNGGGYIGRVAEKRYHDRPFICNHILLSIIYFFSFICLLTAIIWLSYCFSTLSNNSTQICEPQEHLVNRTTLPPSLTTTVITSMLAPSTASPNNLAGGASTVVDSSLTAPEAISAHETSNCTQKHNEQATEKEINGLKSKTKVCQLVFAFTILHFVMLIIRSIVFLFLYRVRLHSLTQKDCKVKVPIVVRLQNLPPLPDVG